MEDNLFNELVSSLKEAKAIKRRELPASRCFTAMPIDVKAVRAKTGLTQREFAQMIQISTRTLQNWEQRRRHPTGPAAALLKIISAAPEVALRSLHET